MRRPVPPRKVGRPGISDLPSTPPKFDLSLTPGFETAGRAAHEDRLKARKLRRQAMSVSGKKARALTALADAVDPNETPYPTTPASSRYMRDARLRIIGQLWALIDARGHSPQREREPVATFTLVAEGNSELLGELRRCDPRRRVAALRQHLLRSAKLMGIKPEGFLFACLHGAYDPATETYPLHFHGVAVGGMIDVVEGLRQLPKYRPARPFEEGDRANVPVWKSRGLLTNMPAPLTYVMKSYWPLRATRLDADGVRRAVSGKVLRIPKPAYSECLRFLDAWRLEDMTLMMGMRATRQGLVRR